MILLTTDVIKSFVLSEYHDMIIHKFNGLFIIAQSTNKLPIYSNLTHLDKRNI